MSVNKIKIGCAYAYIIRKYGYPPPLKLLPQALKEISAMGFRYTELEGLGREWNEHLSKNHGEYQKLLDDLDLKIYNYCIVDPILVSSNRSERQAAYDLYVLGCETAKAYGADSVHIATYTPPLNFQELPYELHKEYQFDIDFRARVPNGFCWQQVWDTLVESCRAVCEVAKPLGMDVLVEPRVGETIANSESMLMLINDVGYPNLKANFDFAHLSAQREILALSWKKLERFVGGIHVADNDIRTIEHLPIASGVIDWEHMLRLIAASNYRGYMGIDVFGREGLDGQSTAESRQKLIELIGTLGLSDNFEI